MRRLVVLLILVVASGCAKKTVPFGKEFASPGFESGRQFLIGKWFGEAPLEGGGKRMWLSQRFADGTYVVTFQAYENGKCVAELSEYGDWGLSGDIYFTMMRGYGTEVGRDKTSEPRSSYRDDAYRITKLTPDEFHYTSVATGRSYLVRKMPADFSLPKMPNEISEPAVDGAPAVHR